MEILLLSQKKNVFLTRNVRGNILQRYPHIDTSLSVTTDSDRNRRRDLGEEKAVRLFRNRKICEKWHMRELFVDLLKTIPCQKSSNRS
jgi:hypothetical protein